MIDWLLGTALPAKQRGSVSTVDDKSDRTPMKKCVKIEKIEKVEEAVNCSENRLWWTKLYVNPLGSVP